ncbi:hypothetical protein B0T11DRAFT_324716 [Plectosphaerella cucumerina]|uniref:Uncharacterized protein n=1 Tax=Plectosphaerella cucumerina TaxID=40658 RepID=A0A8K0TQW4_9PEZI|nr:hypothetical protein B0T11DRAFT_324716 [Plectosphaerella cucumerina]
MPTIGNIPHEARQNTAEPTDRIEWDGESMYGGEVAAIIIGATIGGTIIMVAILWFFKRKSRRQIRQQQKEKRMAIENGDNAIMEEAPVTGGAGVNQTTPARDVNYTNGGTGVNQTTPARDVNYYSGVNAGGASGPTATGGGA